MLADYYVESNRLGHYLVFDGDDNTKERVVAHLEQNGMPVRYARKSIRPADNERRYDWFARLEFQGDREQCQHELARILSLEESHYSQIQINRNHLSQPGMSNQTRMVTI